MSGLFWTFFGYVTSNDDIMFINMLAVVCNGGYLFALSYYIQYNDLKKSKKFAAAFRHYSLVHQDHYDSQLANHEGQYYTDSAG